jgi:hypothetical protein
MTSELLRMRFSRVLFLICFAAGSAMIIGYVISHHDRPSTSTPTGFLH